MILNPSGESNSANEVLGALALPRSTAIFAYLSGCSHRFVDVATSRQSRFLLGNIPEPLQSQLGDPGRSS